MSESPGPLNENILKLIKETSLAILILGVLVWFVQNTFEQADKDRKIREEQQNRMAEVILQSLGEANKDRDRLNITVRELADKIISTQKHEERVYDLLSKNFEETRALRVQVLEKMDSFIAATEGQADLIHRSIQLKKPDYTQ